jgi:hypothetical protein
MGLGPAVGIRAAFLSSCLIVAAAASSRIREDVPRKRMEVNDVKHALAMRKCLVYTSLNAARLATSLYSIARRAYYVPFPHILQCRKCIIAQDAWAVGAESPVPRPQPLAPYVYSSAIMYNPMEQFHFSTSSV